MTWDPCAWLSDEELDEWITRYRPAVPRLRWTPQVRAMVVETITLHHLRYPKTQAHVLLRYAGVFTRLCIWSLDQHLPLDRDVLLDQPNVELFVRRARHPSVAAQDRGCLRKLAESTTRRTTWPTFPSRIQRPHEIDPYTDDELRSLESFARGQSTLTRRRAAEWIVHLGAGAGLWGSALLGVGVGDIHDVGDGLNVIVPGRWGQREIPIRAHHERRIRELLTELVADEPHVLAGPTAHKYGLNYLANQQLDPRPAHVPLLVPRRLRQTWILAQLRNGTRVDLIERLTDLRPWGLVVRLAERLPPPTDADLRRLRTA